MNKFNLRLPGAHTPITIQLQKSATAAELLFLLEKRFSIANVQDMSLVVSKKLLSHSLSVQYLFFY